MKKILLLCVMSFIVSTSFAVSQQQYKPEKATTLYHGYAGKQYIADSSRSTSAYVTTQTAEKYRPIRIQIFVPGLFIGRFGTTIDYKINNAFAIGGLFRTWSDSGTDETQTCTNDPDGWPNCSFHQTHYDDFYHEYGINMEYAVNGNLNMSGWIVNPRILQASYRYHDGFLETDQSKVNVTQQSTEVGIYLMHQWAWPTGIFMQLGIGADWMSNPNKNAFSVSSSHFAGDWDYTIGYAF